MCSTSLWEAEVKSSMALKGSMLSEVSFSTLQRSSASVIFSYPLLKFCHRVLLGFLNCVYQVSASFLFQSRRFLLSSSGELASTVIFNFFFCPFSLDAVIFIDCSFLFLYLLQS